MMRNDCNSLGLFGQALQLGETLDGSLESGNVDIPLAYDQREHQS